MMFNFVFDAGHQMALGSDRLPPVNPVQPKTVIRLKRYRFGRFSPVVGQARPYDERQRRHVNNREMLDRTYLTAFLDVEVPNDVVSNATCKDLLRVWWILSDIAGCLTEYLSGAPARDGEVAWLSATITKRDLERCVADSLSVDLVRAAALLQHFIFRPTSTSEIFEQSFWWTPLVPITPDLISVLIPPLLVGDPMRLMEGILRRSGVINLKGESNRGKVFEKHVRKVVSEALNENELLGEAIVLMEDFKRDEDGGEEIDLVVKIGNVVLIGEAKCLLPPTDPAGRHNYAKQLMGAASQASRKAEFARSKPESVLSALGVTVDDQDQVKFVPLVVLNQGIGHGFASGDVALVDLHWLESLLVSGTTVVGMAFKEGSAIQFEHEMYFSLEDFEMKVEELLLRPPPMGRYSGAIAWRLENIPLGEGGALALEVPYLAKPI